MTNKKSAQNDAHQTSQNARRKIERRKAEQRSRQRRRRLGIAGGACVLALGVAAVTVSAWPSSKTAGPATDPAAASQNSAALTPLAPARAQNGDPVDGIESGSMEQLAYHIHAHLSVFVDGRQKGVPYGVGIIPPYQMAADDAGNPFVNNGKGIYWLHTHDGSGVIHMEAPAGVSFTLGEFFDMWGQPLSSTQVGPAHGPVTVLVDGRAQSGDPRAVPLTAHAVIQLDVGTQVPFQNYTFPGRL